MMVSRLLLLTVAYFATGWLGLQIPYAGTHITLVWLPTGIAVAALLRWDRGVWPAVYLGALLVNLSIGSPWLLAAGIAVGNTLAPLLTVEWLKRAGFHPAFDRQRDVGTFLLGAGLGMLVSASCGVANLYLAGLMPVKLAVSAWLSWWMGDSVGVLLAAPLLLTLNRKNIGRLSRDRRALLRWLLVAAPVAWLTFFQDYEQFGRSLPLGFLTLPLFAWAALRFGVTGAALAGLGFSLVAAWGTTTGHGTFFLSDTHISLLLLWTYMATTVATGLLITALQAERLSVENILRGSEEKLRGLYELSPLGIALTDMNGRYVEFNEAFKNICGYSEGELKALDYWALTPRKYEADETRQLESLTRTGHYGPYEKEYLRKDGSLVPLRLNGMLIAGDDGQSYIWSIVEDITVDKLHQQRMEHLLAEQKAILENDLIGIVTVRDRSIVWANPAFENMLGFGPGELAGIPTRQNYPNEEAYRAFGAAAYPVLKEGKIYRSQIEHMRKDGKRIWVDISGAILDSETGESLWGFVDITERRQLEQSVAENEQRMELALAGADLGMWDLDIPSGKCVHNPRLLTMFGYTFNEIEANVETFRARLHPADIDDFNSHFYAHLKGEVPSFQIEHRVRHKDDHWIWVVSRGKVVTRDESGRALRITGTSLDISERKRQDAALKARETRLSTLLASMQDIVVVFDTGGTIVEYFHPPHLTRPSYKSQEDVLGKTYDQVLPDEVASQISEALAGIMMDGQPRTVEYCLTIEGKEYFSLATLSPLLGDTKFPTGFLQVIRDITAERTTQRKLEQLAHTNALFLESIGEGLYGVDLSSRTTFVNPAAQAMLGFTEFELLGQDQHALIHHHRQDGTAYPSDECPIRLTMQDGLIRRVENEWFWRKDGSGFPVVITVTPVIERGCQVGVMVVFQDISERKASEAKIHELAFFDSLTDLPNRRLLLDRLGLAQPASARRDTYGAILFLDLDNFKSLNDTKGHDFGDWLLQEVATRLLSCVRAEDTVARLGGDEFVVMIEGLDADVQRAANQAECIAEKIRDALSMRYLLHEYEYHCTSSIGISLFKGRTLKPSELLKRADIAMYQAKSAGRNTVRLFQDD